MLSAANPNQKIYKFIFTAHIKTVSLALKFPCVVSIIWKRGEKAQQIKQRKPIQKGIINFNEQLQLQCNMTFDNNKKIFQEKKTKFTILIFSQKGNKQAGQVHLDVAQLLNSKSKLLQLQKNLQKCPDKNAKLILTLSGYMKQQISEDLVSKRSQKTYDIQANLNQITNVQPDFKKKKNQALVVDNSNKEKQKSKKLQVNKNNENKNIMTSLNKLTQQNTSSSSSNNSITPTSIRSQKSQQSQKQKFSSTVLNKSSSSLVILQKQNQSLKLQLQQLSTLQLQNQNLKRKYQQADKKAVSYYKKKYKQIKQQQNQLLEKSKQIKQLIKKKEELENTYCMCKQSIGKIFNYVIMTGNQKLMDFLEAQEL